jgi:hypothetical protein
MVLEQLTDALGLSAFDPAVQVVVLTVVGGVAVKAGALAFWRNTEKLFAVTTYLKVGLLLALAAAAVVLAARRGMVAGGISSLTVYALVLAKLADQSYSLATGG